MNIGIFHITDVHTEEGSDVVNTRLSQLAAYAMSAASRLDQIIWAITGDISYSGQKTELDIFLKSFIALTESIKNRYPSISQKTIVVPGNHDVNMDLDPPLRDTTVKAIKTGVERNITAHHIQACVAAQKPFADAFTNAGIEHCGDQLFKNISHKVGAKYVEFVLVNTAWISEKKEKYGSLHLPLDSIQKLTDGTTGDITVILLHHPVSWFDEATQRHLREALESAETICLFGHEHEPDVRAIQPLALSSELPTIVVDGGVLYEKNSPQSSSFNLLELNVEDERLTIHKVVLKDSHFIDDTIVERNFKCSQSALRKKTKLRKRTLQWAEEHELQLFKGAVSNPSLRQLYIFPEADDIAETRASRGMEHVVRTSDLLKSKSPALLFVGSEKTGKTALLKSFFGHLWASGMTPVYIGGEEIHKTSRDHLSRVIDKAYREQYEVDRNASWFSLPEDRQYLIIDDIDQSRLSETSFPSLFNTITDLIPRFALSSTDMFNLEGPAFEALAGSPKRPRLLRLRHFGNALRDELVLAWLRLDRPSDITNEELLPEAESLRKRLNQILCDDVVPKTPFFLLTILQSISETPNAELSKSALGYYYEFLLTNGLLKAGVSSEQLTKYHSVFTELAFTLLSKGRTNFKEADLRVFFNKHVTEYELKLNWEQLLKVGQAARVLGRRDEVFCFYYSYQFLFYAGKALAKRLDTGEGLELFRHLLARSYNIDIANIILFVAHHTKHQQVMEELLVVCESLFSNVPPMRFAEDVAVINQLVSDAPKLYASNKSTEESRRHRLKEMDRAEEEETPHAEQFMLLERREIQLRLDFEGPKTLSNISGFERVNVASKFVEIVGQALRNHHSEIPKAQKTKIIKAGTLLGLRAANHVITEIANDFAKFVPQFAANLDPLQRVDFHKKFGRAAFSFLAMIACVFVKGISSSFGYSELADTYNRVLADEIWIPLEGSESHGVATDKLATSKGLVHLAINLEDGGTLPFKQIQELRAELSGNTLAEFVLRFLILDHMSMYPLSTQDKQRVNELLGIGVQAQEVMELMGKREKL